MVTAGREPEWENSMTPEERQMLASLFERVGSTASTPRDPQAETFIADAVRALPFAPYVLAQTVLVQQQALENASQRLAELEAKAAPPQEETSFLGSIGKTLFGGGASAPPPRPSYAPDPNYQRQPAYGAPPPQQPSYAPPPPQGGPWGQQGAAPTGGGFMQSALTTAAGVAGGVVLAHSLGSLFGGGHSGLGGFGGGGLGGGEVVNNFYESAPGTGEHPAEAGEHHSQDAALDGHDNADYQDVNDSYDSSGGDDGSYDT
jgi:uncharacterized protein